MTERHLIRWVLYSVPLICALQWLVVRKIGEPYPAVIMPSFAEDGKPRPTYLRPTLILKTGGAVIYEGSAFELLSDVDYSAARAIVFKRLRHDTTLSSEAANWAIDRARRIDPRTNEVIIRWRQHTYSSENAPKWLGDLVIK
jgi:hypothetical protein